jgi:hypothetical protein
MKGRGESKGGISENTPLDLDCFCKGSEIVFKKGTTSSRRMSTFCSIAKYPLRNKKLI